MPANGRWTLTRHLKFYVCALVGVFIKSNELLNIFTYLHVVTLANLYGL